MTLDRFAPGVRRKIAFAKYNVIPFRASLVLRHFAKRFISVLGIQRGFRIIDLAITFDCNLSCAHCSAKIMKQKKELLTLDNYEKIVEESKKLDVLSWNITGGEPLLVDWLDDLIRILEPQRHYISVQTNGVLLSERRAKELARLGVNCITTSIDSINEQEHDAFRGRKDAFNETFRGITNAKQAGIQVLVGGTITHQNLRSRELEMLIHFVNKAGAIFLFNLAVPCGEWRGRDEFLLRGNDREYLIQLMKKYPLTSTDHEVGRNNIGCPAGVEKVYITPYGDVLPCPFIHISFGNARKESLVKIVSRMQTVDWFNRYQKVCIAAEDFAFHREVLDKICCEFGQYPADCNKIFPEISSIS